MKAVYKKLLKIKNPVLIEVRYIGDPSLDKYRILYGDPSLDRYRILYPDGKCEYFFIIDYYIQFNRSCFQKSTLKATVKGMECYDDVLKIVKIQEIK